MTTPHAVQLAALSKCGGASGFGYFMEQGLGKTFTTFLDFKERVAERTATRLVVVCPNSFKSGWVAEAAEHGTGLTSFIWEANMHSYLDAWMKRGFAKPPMLVVNWEAIRSEATQQAIAKFVEPVKGRAMVAFDESIQAKTHNSDQTKGGIALAKEFDYQRILSGKPIAQGPHDLWGQMRLIRKLDGFNYFAFRNAFCKMGGFKMKSVVGAINEDILAERIEPHVFRATKADWTDLPPKTYTMREYKLTPEMKSMYDQMYNDFVLWLGDDEAVTVDAAITKYIKLAQIQCGWIFDDDGNYRQLVDDKKNPRLNLLQQIVEEEVTGKVAIPYNNKPVFEQLVRTFGGESKCAYIKGGMQPHDIDEQKRRFNKERGVRYIFLQTRAAKYGHTLLGLPEPGNMCYTMVPYQNTYSLDDRSQIEDRIHRHGQIADSVSYIDLIGTPLDRDCVRALQRKEDVFQSVFRNIRSSKR